MKDDESRLLGASQASGKIVSIDAMRKDRVESIRRKWERLGWVDSDGVLTPKCMAKSRGIKPEKPPEEEKPKRRRRRKKKYEVLPLPVPGEPDVADEPSATDGAPDPDVTEQVPEED